MLRTIINKGEGDQRILLNASPHYVETIAKTQDVFANRYSLGLDVTGARNVAKELFEIAEERDAAITRTGKYENDAVFAPKALRWLDTNEAVLQALIDEKDGDTGIYTYHDKDFFTQEEWNDILNVFDKLHPTMLMLERKGRPLTFYIAFASKILDGTTKSTHLYWFPNDEERAYHEEDGVFPDGTFTKIDEGWYVVETTNTR